MRIVVIFALLLALILIPSQATWAEEGGDVKHLATDSLLLAAAVVTSFTSLLLWSLYSSKYEDYRNARDVVEAKRLYSQAHAYYVARNAALIISGSIWAAVALRNALRPKKVEEVR